MQGRRDGEEGKKKIHEQRESGNAASLIPQVTEIIVLYASKYCFFATNANTDSHFDPTASDLKKTNA